MSRLAELAELGFCGITVPEEFGGQGSDLLGACLVLEELSAMSPPLAAQYAAAALWGGAALNALGSDEQKKRLLPGCARGTNLVALALGDPDDQSWPSAEAPVFTRSGDECILNGSWNHVFPAEQAGLFLVAALEQDRESVDWTIFLTAPKTGMFMEPMETLGLHGTALGRVAFDQVRLPVGSVLGGPEQMGQGSTQWAVLAGLVSLAWAALAVGLARGAFEYALEYSKQRIQFKQPIGSFPAMREKITDLETNLNAARLLTHQAASLANAGQRFARMAHQAQLLAVRTARDAGLGRPTYPGGVRVHPGIRCPEVFKGRPGSDGLGTVPGRTHRPPGCEPGIVKPDMDVQFDFNGQVVLVTGAAGGIGSRVAAGFAQRRARVLAVDLAPAIETLAAEYGATGLIADVSLADQVSRMMDHCLEHLGPPDVLVNLAAISTPCLVEKMDLANWQRNLDVNLTSVYLCTTAALPHMMERTKGVIISFSSVVAEMGGKSSAHYAAAKAGVEAFSRSLAREVGPLGIRVNVVAPGMVDTPMLDLMSPEQKQALASRLPLPRLGRPEDLVGPVLFLASDAAAYITGHTLDVNGGLVMS